MSTQPPKNLVGIDFDHTLVQCNSDLCVKALIPEGVQYPPRIDALRKNKNGWIEFMRQVFCFLHVNGISRPDYNRCLSAMALVPGMKELFKAFEESHDYEVIILSDANSVFIERVLLEHGLKSIVHNVFTNPAHFDETGCLRIKEYQVQKECKLCTRNICKGAILQKYASDRECHGNPFERIYYIGDGMNDICPALKLGSNDVAYARRGYSMLKKLRKLPDDAICANVVAWNDGYDIKNELFPAFGFSDLIPNLNVALS